MGLTRRWAGIGGAIVVAALGSGCSALTSFGDLAFGDDDAAIVRDGRVPVTDGAAEAEVHDGATDAPPGDGDAAPPRDAGPDAPPLDGDPSARDLGSDAPDGGPPPMDADVPPMDGGPPPVDTGPFDVGPPPADTASVECRSNADCDDFEQCTSDTCNTVTGNCTNTRLDGLGCTDGNECTQADTCRAGTCAGIVVPCMPSGQCVASFCDPTIGCLDENVPAGVACDDGDACSPSSMCDGAGNCQGDADCQPDGNPCNVEICRDRECDSVSVLDGTGCPGGACCDGACVSTTTDEQNCGMCGARCLMGQSCVAGICSTCGSDSACNDGLPCTMDTCVGTCSNTLTTGCLINGACVAAGADNPDNQCEECRPPLSPTSWSPKDEGSPCIDGLFCTTGEVCVSGQCEGTGDPCSAMTGGCLEYRCNETLHHCDRLGGCISPFSCCDDSFCALPAACFF